MLFSLYASLYRFTLSTSSDVCAHTPAGFWLPGLFVKHSSRLFRAANASLCKMCLPDASLPQPLTLTWQEACSITSPHVPQVHICMFCYNWPQSNVNVVPTFLTCLLPPVPHPAQATHLSVLIAGRPEARQPQLWAQRGELVPRLRQLHHQPSSQPPPQPQPGRLCGLQRRLPADRWDVALSGLMPWSWANEQ